MADGPAGIRPTGTIVVRSRLTAGGLFSEMRWLAETMRGRGLVPRHEPAAARRPSSIARLVPGYPFEGSLQGRPMVRGFWRITGAMRKMPGAVATDTRRERGSVVWVGGQCPTLLGCRLRLCSRQKVQMSVVSIVDRSPGL